MLQEVYIKENDFKLVIWGQTQTSIKLKQYIVKLIKFIELLAQRNLDLLNQEDYQNNQM